MVARLDHPIVGTWRLTSFTENNLETGAISYPFGKGARAIVIYTADGYAATIFTQRERNAPAGPQVTDKEAIDLYRSMIAFAGPYEVAEGRLIYRPELSWDEAWNGSTQERLIEVSGDRLETNSVPSISPITGARTAFSLVWERAS